MTRLPRASFVLLLTASLLTGCTSAPPPVPPPAAAPEPEPEPAPAVPSERPIYIVKADRTQLRDDPTTKSLVLGRLAKNTRVTGLKEQDGWIFVRLTDNRVGWIRADLLRREAPATDPMKPMTLK